MKIHRYLILSSLLCGLLLADVPENWDFSPTEYENFMTVTAVLEVNNTPSTSDNIVLGAFIEEECRGYTYPILVGEQWMYFLMVYGNNNEIIEFEVYDEDNDLVAPVNDAVTFYSGGVPYGMPDDPVILSTTLSSIMLGDVNFDTQINILDIVIIVNIILPGDGWNGGNPPSEEQLTAADVNQDGSLNVLDIVVLVNIILPDTLSREIVWYYDGTWKYETSSSNKATRASLLLNDEYLGINSDGDIAGIQLHVSGEYEINDTYLPLGWEIKAANDMILLFSLDGSNLVNNKLFEYSGTLEIQSSIATDWFGSDVDVNTINVPNFFSLHSPYPNPFNPITTIEFSVSTESYIEVNIYDINGHLIENLTKSNFTPGHKSINWDASGYASGVYIVKILTDKFVDSQKLYLVK